MRQFDFWGSWDDSFAIITALLGTGKAIVFPDMPYAEPQARFFEQLTPELQAIAREQGKLFLWLPGISDPLQIRFGKWDSGIHAGQYFVSGSGPYLELVLPGCYTEGNLIRLRSGFLACDHEFYLPDAKIVVATPRAAQGLHGEFVKIIKDHCRRFGPKKRWVGRHASQLLEEGKAEVASPGYYK